jgi:hypothetical protein
MTQVSRAARHEALRDEVHRAAARTAWLRTGVRGSVSLIFIGAAFAAFLIFIVRATAWRRYHGPLDPYHAHQWFLHLAYHAQFPHGPIQAYQWFLRLLYQLSAGFLSAGLAGSLLVFLPWKKRYCSRQRRRLREKLTAMPHHEQAGLLLPLADRASWSAREIVLPLVGELRASAATEVAPAPAPEGRGNEPSPGEPCHPPDAPPLPPA